MAKIIIDQKKCKGCLLCVSFCPKACICVDENLNSKGIRPVKFSRQANQTAGGIPSKTENENAGCLGCALCAIICPDCCIEVYK